MTKNETSCDSWKILGLRNTKERLRATENFHFEIRHVIQCDMETVYFYFGHDVWRKTLYIYIYNK